MTQQFKHDIETKGFYKLSEQEALDLIRIDEFRLLNTEERSRDNGQSDVNPELAERLQTFGQYLKFKYILPNWPDTDMFEDYDIFFLYYFDNSEPKTGGAINFKWGSLDGDPQTAAYYPKAGDLFAVSNHRGFWHKAESTSITRRVASFDFTTEKD